MAKQQQESLKGPLVWACVIFVGVMVLGYFWTDILGAI